MVIEWCPVMCCTKIVQDHAGRQPNIRVEMVQDYGVKKSSALSYGEQEKEQIKRDIVQRVEQKRRERNNH